MAKSDNQTTEQRQGASATGDTQVPHENQAYVDQLSLQSQSVQPDMDAIRRTAAQQKAAHLRDEQEAEEARLAREEMEKLQRETETVIVAEEQQLKLNGGGVKLQYLGTSDEFDLGVDEDSGKHVIARAGGEAVDVPKDVAEHLMTGLIHDQFQEIK